jgi:hypothetical protein
MKKQLINPGIIFFLLSVNITLTAQTIQPDKVFASNVEDLVWYPNGTSFCSFNGTTYMFVWTREEPKVSYDYFNWYPYVYEFVNGDFQPFMVKNSQKLEFHYLHEDGAGYAVPYRRVVTIMGTSVAFTYYGQLWYTCLIERPPYPDYYPGELYYRLWARYENDIEGWVTWYDSLNYVPEYYPMGACQVDSMLQIVSLDVTYELSIKLESEEYIFNGITKKLDRTEQEPFYIKYGSVNFGGMIPYKDTLGQQCYLYTSWADGGGGANIFYSHSYLTNYLEEWGEQYFDGGAATMCDGSARGLRTAVQGPPESSRRYNIFYINPDKNAGGTYDLRNMELSIPDDPKVHPQVMSDNKVNLPSTNGLQKLDGDFQIGSSYSMIPMNYDSSVSGLDALKQQIQVFYPDKDGRIYGAFFTSDTWRPVPGSSVQSDDLEKDSTYGPEIRKLWTLVGMTDGAPPCAMDWTTWEDWHYAEDATTFSFKLGQTATSEVSSTYEDAYSLGAKLVVPGGGFVKSQSSFKYTNDYSSMVKSGTEVHAQLSKNFALNPASQDYGYKIWMIPSITRTSYQVYPWYDSVHFQYPVTTSLQYQFRTESMKLQTENVPVSDFPFLIDQPNEEQMTDWTEESRYMMVNSAFYAGVKPVFTLTYTSPNPGDALDFSKVNTSVSSVETSNKYEIENSAGIGIPKVFQLTGSMGGKISYTSEISYQTSVGTEVEVSLENLDNAEMFGILNPKYDVDLYWFKPNVSHWWYIDSLDGQQPWYFGYVVSIGQIRIILESPLDEINLKPSDLVFSWSTENGDVSDFELFISTEAMTGPGSTVYQLPCAGRMMASPLDFKPEPGRTYFWSVRGITENGEVRWSRSRSFTVGKPEETVQSALKAEIYPNPGKSGQFYISYDLPKAGNVSYFIYSINGQLLLQSGQIYRSAGLTTEEAKLPEALPGIYLVVIHADDAIVTKKLIIRK